MNNLFKGSNSKFVMNLFKSLGVACAVVTVNSCNTDKPKNGNNSDDATEKKILGNLKKKFNIADDKEDEILKKIKSLKGKSENEIEDAIVKEFKLELKTSATPDTNDKPKKGKGAPSSVDLIKACKSLDDFEVLIRSGIKSDDVENQKALQSVFSDKEIDINGNLSISGFEIRDKGTFERGLKFIDYLRNNWGYKKVCFKLGENFDFNWLFVDSAKSLNVCGKNFKLGKVLTKVRIQNFVASNKNLKFGKSVVVCEDLNKVIDLLRVLGSFEGSKDYFEIIEVKFKNDRSGKCEVLGCDFDVLVNGKVKEGCNILRSLKDVSFCSVLDGVFVSRDVNGSEVSDSNNIDLYIGGVKLKDIKNFENGKALNQSNIKEVLEIVLCSNKNLKFDGDNNCKVSVNVKSDPNKIVVIDNILG